MSTSGFTPLEFAQWFTLFLNAFQSSLAEVGIEIDVMPDASPDAVVNAEGNGLSTMAMQLQYQAQQYQLSSRLANTPANADGTVSADAASFGLPFGVIPAPGAYASSTTYNLNLLSLSSVPVTVTCGFSILRGDGLQYVLIPDTTQANYNGNNGYTFPPNTDTVTGTFICLTQGEIGNVAIPGSTTWTPYGGVGSLATPIIGSVTNTDPITGGTNAEQQTAYVARFAEAMQNGQWGVETAIIAAALGVQAGLTVSYGDHVNQDSSYHQAYFTLVVNVLGSAVAPLSTLLTQITTVIMNVRSGGIEFQVVAPHLVAPTITGNVAVFSGNNQASVTAAVAAAVQNEVNNIGLNQSGGSTTLSYAQTLALMISISGVNPAGTTLLFNGGTTDITAAFGSQIVCPVAPVFTST